MPLIAYSNDALTVRLSGVQNSDILAELARQSGAEIRGQVREPREVTADFESVPLPEALARLLGEQNFALVYGKGGRLKAVRLLGGDQLGAPASPTITVPPAAPGAPFPGSLPELIDRHPPAPVAGCGAGMRCLVLATRRMRSRRSVSALRTHRPKPVSQ